MIKKILIANRGEIALRIARTARKMGIATVAIYSEQDARSNHVKFCDESYSLGSDLLAESYLNIGKIVEIAKTSSVDAVHPGYGFLSENYIFAEELEANNLIFIGPPSKSIRDILDKIQSKIIARKANVNCIPGFDEIVKEKDTAIRLANEIGYPVMIKASSGGGGKGMRIAFNDAELTKGLISARNESLTAFGDERIFIEKYIENPRHIEIQIVADKKGNTIWLGERECSIQRRHQKIIEETPSPFVDENLRKLMGDQAVRLAKSVNYFSVGTIEFVVSEDKSFYFLEMNTRLQVEHPVTEMTLNLDLVKMMIEIAEDKTLKLEQKDLKIDGCAIECRICAEEPIKNFLPSVGRITRYSAPTENYSLRIDSGCEEGSEISIYYDPLLAKLITKGKNREDAIIKMSDALDKFVINGVKNNIIFLSSLINSSRYREGKTNTNFITDEYPDGYNAVPASKSIFQTMAFSAIFANALDVINFSKDLKLVLKSWVVCFFGKKVDLRLDNIKGEIISVCYEKETKEFYFHWDTILGLAYIRRTDHKKTKIVKTKKVNGSYQVGHLGANAVVNVYDNEDYNIIALLPEKKHLFGANQLKSPMPGRVVSINVEVGQKVEVGDDLIVLDAMKMENILRSETEGIISEILVKVNDIVSTEQELIYFKLN